VTGATKGTRRLLKSPELWADSGVVRAGRPRNQPRPEGEVQNNNVQHYRETQMMSKAELARKAGVSALTIDRVEAGRPCRLDTKRKILLALGLKVTDRDRVFGALTGRSPEEASAELSKRHEA
jgi:DNA-binding XRE family transcriptional regulator